MSDTPDAYVTALAEERLWHPDRKTAIDGELDRAGWYVDDDGNLAKAKGQPVAERADAEPAPENTAEPKPQRASRAKAAEKPADDAKPADDKGTVEL